MTVAFLIATTAAVLAALAVRRRNRSAQRFPKVMYSNGTALPPIGADEIASIRHDAEQAAMRQAQGGQAVPNPHAPGTRAHIIWEGHRGATLMAWDARPTDAER